MNIPENIRHMTVENAMRSLGVKLPRRCEHIMSNGQFCGSPALRGRNYCYFHLTHIGRQICAERAYERLSTAGGDSPDAPFSLPALEDANSVQIGLMQVMDAILHNRLDSKRAGLLLYGLQTASSNLANGADFSVPSGEATVGGYDAFEQDYELDDDVPELKVDENDAAEEYEEEEDEEEEEEEGEDGEEEEEGEDGEGEDGELDEDDLEDSDEAESEDEQDSAEAEANLKTNRIPPKPKLLRKASSRETAKNPTTLPKNPSGSCTGAFGTIPPGPSGAGGPVQRTVFRGNLRGRFRSR